MAFTLLSQHEIEQIPDLIYKKIVIEHTNILEINTKLSQTINTKDFTINDLNKQIIIYKNNLYNLNLSKYFLEIENEVYKNRIKSVDKIIYIIQQDFEGDNKPSSKTSSSATSSTNDSSVITKLIKKIKILTNKYKAKSAKYKTLFADYLNIIKSKDELFHEYNKIIVDNKKSFEYDSLLEKSSYWEKEYYNILNQYNNIDFELKQTILMYKDYKYKYTRYVLSNRDDILPVIGNELDSIKDKIFEFTKLSENLDIQEIFNKYWEYINKLRDIFNQKKHNNKPFEYIQSELENMRNLIDNISDIIENNSDTYCCINKDIKNIYGLITDIYKIKLTENDPENYNNLLLEIYTYKKEIERRNGIVEKLKDDINILRNEIYIKNRDIEHKDEEIKNKVVDLDIKNVEIKNKDAQLDSINKSIIILNNKLIELKKEVDLKTDIINKQNLSIQEKDSKIEKLLLILSKLKQVKEEYVNLRKSIEK